MAIVIARASESTVSGVDTFWSSSPPARDYRTFPNHQYAGIEHHHSVTANPPSLDGAIQLVQAIQDDHLSRGWTDVFYGWFIHHPTGALIEGRGWNRSQGSENTWDPDGAGDLPSGFLMPVCHIGDYRSNVPMLAGLMATEHLRGLLWQRNREAAERDYRLHRDRAATVCPGPNITHKILNGLPRKDPSMPIPEWAVEAYAWAQANGVVVGDPDPGSTITEARLVTFLHRAALAYPEAPPAPPLTAKQVRDAISGTTFNLSTRAVVS